MAGPRRAGRRVLRMCVPACIMFLASVVWAVPTPPTESTEHTPTERKVIDHGHSGLPYGHQPVYNNHGQGHNVLYGHQPVYTQQVYNLYGHQSEYKPYGYTGYGQSVYNPYGHQYGHHSNYGHYSNYGHDYIHGYGSYELEYYECDHDREGKNCPKKFTCIQGSYFDSYCEYPCPPDFIHIGDACYKLGLGKKKKLNFENSLQRCEEAGAKLLFFENEQEYSRLRNVGNNFDGEYIDAKFQNGAFRRSNGEKINWNNLIPSFGDELDILNGATEGCVALHRGNFNGPHLTVHSCEEEKLHSCKLGVFRASSRNRCCYKPSLHHRLQHSHDYVNDYALSHLKSSCYLVGGYTCAEYIDYLKSVGGTDIGPVGGSYYFYINGGKCPKDTRLAVVKSQEVHWTLVLGTLLSELHEQQPFFTIGLSWDRSAGKFLWSNYKSLKFYGVDEFKTKTDGPLAKNECIGYRHNKWVVRSSCQDLPKICEVVISSSPVIDKEPKCGVSYRGGVLARSHVHDYGYSDHYDYHAHDEADFAEYPWHGAVFENGKFQCSCVLIDDKWAITSTYCVTPKDANNIRVHLGIWDLGDKPVVLDPEIRRVEEIVVTHYGSTHTKFGYDKLALLHLRGKVNTKTLFHVGVACLPSPSFVHEANVGWACTVVGWPKKHGHRKRDVYKILDVQLTSPDECKYYVNHHYDSYGHGYGSGYYGYHDNRYKLDPVCVYADECLDDEVAVLMCKKPRVFYDYDNSYDNAYSYAKDDLGATISNPFVSEHHKDETPWYVMGIGLPQACNRHHYDHHHDHGHKHDHDHKQDHHGPYDHHGSHGPYDHGHPSPYHHGHHDRGHEYGIISHLYRSALVGNVSDGNDTSRLDKRDVSEIGTQSMESSTTTAEASKPIETEPTLESTDRSTESSKPNEPTEVIDESGNVQARRVFTPSVPSHGHSHGPHKIATHTHGHGQQSHGYGHGHGHGHGQQPHGYGHGHGQQPHGHGHGHGQQPHGHGKQPHVHGQQPHGYGHGHGQQPHGHGKQPHVHGQQPHGYGHGQQPHEHGQQPHGYGQQPHVHGQQPHGYGHGQQPHEHGQQPHGYNHGQQPHGYNHGQQPHGYNHGQQPHGHNRGQQPHGHGYVHGHPHGHPQPEYGHGYPDPLYGQGHKPYHRIIMVFTPVYDFYKRILSHIY
ncbi:uncharacterized protein LOC143020651 [Oratosquilla oratoria]|uniref:uncharacterized protein LOC143020651 n=1 Tax=Oratosquilla oratoria TaxID=337810 RepID=UPI003F766B8B